MFPAFLSLTKQFSAVKYAVAQVRCAAKRWGCGVATPAAMWLLLLECVAEVMAAAGSPVPHTLHCPSPSPSTPPPCWHQVDYMHEETRGITYTPTFAVYRQGRKVGCSGLAGVEGCQAGPGGGQRACM